MTDREVLPEDWEGLLKGRRTRQAEVSMVAMLKRSTAGGSGAFLVRADDARRYWLKVVNNPQGKHVPATEQIVGRVGALIGGPTCEVKTVEIPADFAGDEYRPGRRLQPGIAHGSLAVEPCYEYRYLANRDDDDNRRRHAFIFALYDWCWGGDPQWLIAPNDENKYFSHDHGWYLPPSGPRIEIAQLKAEVDNEHRLTLDGRGLHPHQIEEIASALEAVTRNSLVDVLSNIPESWPVADQELETVGYFLERRAPQVAHRLRRRFGGKP